MKYYWIEFDAYKSAKHMRDYVEKVLIGYGADYEINFVWLLISDPTSEISEILKTREYFTLKASFGTEPKLFYLK